ncbi:SsrA-binding protein SmpB [Mycoplasma iguanae]|uniref:SsrA-binding protein n=1 Tax=Mycoplasma iguanae TaxID=292461 RepID=A0ABY5R8Q9_9MOLU|nr:SsrA-binding protein SmpB [Mycoplasma iguanae]UVD81889.1 SsrA-binding protein SmpB [Mycoplasma iguanae]
MKIIAKNKVANYNYEIIDKYEAGIALLGWEVKSIRANKVNLNNAFATFKFHELFISNMHISLYMAVKGDVLRPRKLLMHKAQLKRLALKQQQNNFTLIPTMIYWSKDKIKIEIALARGKNKQDKRETEKKRDIEHEIAKYL